MTKRPDDNDARLYNFTELTFYWLERERQEGRLHPDVILAIAYALGRHATALSEAFDGQLENLWSKTEEGRRGLQKRREWEAKISAQWSTEGGSPNGRRRNDH